MLTELHIENFALIEKQVLHFGKGLNVLSGETGSGKSIILTAIELILGGRAQSKFLRTGAAAWKIQAIFDLSSVPEDVISQLPDIARGQGELILARSAHRSGKSRIYINGTLATLSVLKSVSCQLIALCSQGEHLSLLQAGRHLELLDHFGSYQSIRNAYYQAYSNYERVRIALELARGSQEKASRRRAELEFLISEFEEARVGELERDSLESSISRLANAEKILELSAATEELFNSNESGLYAGIHKLQASLERLRALDPDFHLEAELFDSINAHLSELESQTHQYFSGIELDESALEEQRRQLSEIARLERKYSCSSEALAEMLSEAREELGSISTPESLKRLEDELKLAEGELLNSSSQLRRLRKKAAKDLISQVSSELAGLNMKGAKLELSFREISPGPQGADAVEILLSANKGEHPRPLREIASGGELSRITLVLKKVLRDRSLVNVLVFDEVDTGVSGAVARAVGRKLKELSCDSQVICISHLAQVASLADKNFLVGKESKNRTKSFVRELGDEEKVEEIARMLAGYTITEASRESARELIASK